MLLLGGSVASTALAVIFDHSWAWYKRCRGDATLSHLVPIGIVPSLPTIAYLVDQQAAILAYMDNSKVVALARSLTCRSSRY